MAETKLTAVIEAQDKASAVIGGVGKSMDGLSDKVKAMGPTFTKMAAVGTVAFTAITALAVSSFKAYADAQAQTVITNQSLENSLKSITGATLKNLQKELGTTTDVLGALKTSAENAGKAAIKMGFDDEAAARSFAKLFGVTKDVSQAQKEMTAAMDLARYKNISLEDATQKLIMVHAGATKELKAMGLAVTDGATAIQNIDSIMKQTSGTAQAFSETAEGAMQVMKVNADNLKESIGGALAPAFDKLKQILVPIVQKFVDWAEQNPELLAKIILIAGAVAALVAGLGFLGLVLPGIITAFTILMGPVGLVIAIIAALAFAVMQVVRIVILLRDHWDEVWMGIQLTVGEYIKSIKDALDKGMKAIGDAWRKVWQGIKDFFVGIWEAIRDTARSVLDSVMGFLKPVIDMVDRLISKLQQVGKSVGNAASSAGNWLVDKVGGGINSALGINDGIVQNGRVITTHPDDFIIATKTPGSLGGGKDININISGAVLTEEAARVMGDMIINQLRLQVKF